MFRVSGVLHRGTSSSDLYSIDVTYTILNLYKFVLYVYRCVSLNISSYHMWCQGTYTFPYFYKKI